MLLAVSTESLLIAILVFVCLTFVMNLYAAYKKRRGEADEVQDTPEIATSVAKTTTSAATGRAVPSANHDEETVAAITAAIALVLEEENKALPDHLKTYRAGFQVKSIRRL